MTAEQIAVNATAAAKLAEIEPRGYLMARMYETLANIDTDGMEHEREFADLQALSQALPLVWGLEDADEPAEDEIAVAAAEAITEPDVNVPLVPADDPSELASAPEPEVSEELSPLQKAQRILFGKMGGSSRT